MVKFIYFPLINGFESSFTRCTAHYAVLAPVVFEVLVHNRFASANCNGFWPNLVCSISATRCRLDIRNIIRPCSFSPSITKQEWCCIVFPQPLFQIFCKQHQDNRQKFHNCCKRYPHAWHNSS